MNFGLAAPWLLAALGVGLWVWLAHRTGRKELPRFVLPTVRFVPRDDVPVRRARKLEDLPLFLLRLLALLAITSLFAQPWLRVEALAPEGFDPDRPLLLVVDRSASMGAKAGSRTGLDLARDRAESLITTLGAGSLAGVMVFDSTARLIPPGLTSDMADVRRALAEIDVGAGATDLQAALTEARMVLVGEGITEATIVVLGDGTATRLPGPVPDWPAGLEVQVHDVVADTLPNRWVDAVALSPAAHRGAGWQIETRVAQRGFEPGPVPVRLRLGEGVEVVADAIFEDEAVADRHFTVPRLPDSAVAEVELPPDALIADDRALLTLDDERTLEVVLLSGEGGSSPRDDECYYLQRAFQPTEGSASRVVPRPLLAEEVRRLEGGPGEVFVVANVADPSPFAADLQMAVEAGAGLLLSVGPRVEADRWNEWLSALLPTRLTEVKSRGQGTFDLAPTGLLPPSLDHEALRVFRTGGASVFPQVRFGKVFATSAELSDNAEVVLRYSDGLPALLRRRVGRGQVMLFTSSLDDDWTDLPLRSIYVPLVHQLVRALAGRLGEGQDHLVDAGAPTRVEVPTDPSERAFFLDPTGREHPLDSLAADADGRVLWSGLDRVGAWELRWGRRDDGADSVRRARFRVRVPAVESQLDPIDRSALLAAVPGLRWVAAAEEGAPLPRARVVRDVDVFGPLVLVAAVLLLAESALRLRKTA